MHLPRPALLLWLSLGAPALAAPGGTAAKPAPAKPAPAKPAPGRAEAPRPPAAPARKHTDVVLPAGAGVPGELVPLKPGSDKEKVPGKLEAVLKVGPLAPVSALAYTPDGARLLVGSYGRVAVWDLAAGRVERHLEGVEGAVHAVVVSPDGKQVAVAGGKPALSGGVLVYDLASPGKPLARLEGHGDVVYSCAWSPDSRRLATASLDKQVKLWEVAGGKEQFTVKDHSDFVYAVAFSPDGKFIASGGRDRSVKLFDAATGKSLRTLTGHNEPVLALAIAPDSQSVLSTGEEPAIRWWKLEDGSTFRTQGGHGKDVFEIQYSRDQTTLLTVSQDQTVRLWSAASGGQLKAFGSGGESLLAAALSPDGKRVAAGSWNGLVRVWDVASGRLLVLFFEGPGAAASPEYLVATPEGYLSASPEMTKALRWRVGGVDVAPEPFAAALVRPEEVAKALRGEAVAPVGIKPPGQ